MQPVYYYSVLTVSGPTESMAIFLRTLLNPASTPAPTRLRPEAFSFHQTFPEPTQYDMLWRTLQWGVHCDAERTSVQAMTATSCTIAFCTKFNAPQVWLLRLHSALPGLALQMLSVVGEEHDAVLHCTRAMPLGKMQLFTTTEQDQGTRWRWEVVCIGTVNTRTLVDHSRPDVDKQKHDYVASRLRVVHTV